MPWVAEGGGQALGNNHDSETSSWGRIEDKRNHGDVGRKGSSRQVMPRLVFTNPGKAQLAPETAYAVLKTPQPKTINELFLLVMKMT